MSETLSQTKFAPITEWAEAAKNKGLTSQIRELDENEVTKLKGLRMLGELGLPQYKSIVVNADDFLKSPSKFFSQLESPTYYPNLVGQGKRVRKINLSDKDTILFVNNTLQEEGVRMNLILSEFFPNKFSGNITIGKDGGIRVEMLQSDHQNIVGGETPTIIAERDSILKTMKYFSYQDGGKQELEDVGMKEMIYRTLNLIPKDYITPEDTQDYHPGYYEFTLVQKDPEDERLSPIFLDYRDKDSYIPAGTR